MPSDKDLSARTPPPHFETIGIAEGNFEADKLTPEMKVGNEGGLPSLNEINTFKKDKVDTASRSAQFSSTAGT